MVSTDEVIARAVSLGCELGTHYREPALFFNERHVLSPDRVPGAFSIRLDWEDHDTWLSDQPEVVYKVPHFETWPYVLVRQDAVSIEQLERLLSQAIRVVKKPIKRRML